MKKITSLFLGLSFILLSAISTKAQCNTYLNMNGSNYHFYYAYNSFIANLSPKFTIETWLMAGDTTDVQTIFTDDLATYSGDPVAQNMGLYIGNGDPFYTNHPTQLHSQLSFGLRFDTGSNGNTGTQEIFADQHSKLQPNTWTHVAITFDGSMLRMYINGIEDDSSASPIGGALAAGNGYGYIEYGYDYDNFNSAQFNNGGIDELSLWNSTLTKAQIDSGMNKYTSKYAAGLVNLYHFDDGTTGQASDSKGNIPLSPYYGSYYFLETTSGPSIISPPAPIFTTQPTNTSLCPNSSATINAATLDSGTVFYQWQFISGGVAYNLQDTGAFSGSATSSLNINNYGFPLQLVCQVTGPYCQTINSDSVTYTLKMMASANTSKPFICTGINDTLSTTVTVGSGNYTYLWNTGATTSNLVLSSFATDTAVNDNVTISDVNTGCAMNLAYIVGITTGNSVATTVSKSTICAGIQDTLIALPVSNDTSITNGLVAYYPMDGNTNDISGNGYNATNYGAVSGPDRFGNANSAYYLTGGAYLEAPPAVYFTGDFTVTAWIKPNSIQQWSRIIDFGNGSASDNIIVEQSIGSSQAAGMSVYNGGNDGGDNQANNVLQTGVWTQVVVTFQGTAYNIYYNGVNVGSGNETETPANIVRNNCYIGKSNWAPDGAFDGYIDDLRIYNRALTQNDINTLYSFAPQIGSYTWSDNTLGDTDIVAPTSGPATYTVTFNSAAGCAPTTATTSAITVNATPQVKLSFDTVCPGGYDTVTAIATGNGSLTYSWNNASTSDTIVVNQAAQYVVTVTDGNNCVTIDTTSTAFYKKHNITVMGKDSIINGSTDTLVASGASTFNWTGGGSISTTTDTNYVMPSANATYTVIGTDMHGCLDTTFFSVTILIPTSVNNITDGSKLSAYPVPAIDVVYLAFQTNGTESANIEVMDVMGKVIMNTTSTISNGAALPINISTLAQGTYFVKVTANNHTQTVKFIKQ